MPIRRILAHYSEPLTRLNNYVREWLASDNANMQTFVSYYNDPTSVDIVKRELYAIKASLVWSETEDVFFKHDGGGITSWGILVHNISEAINVYEKILLEGDNNGVTN